MDVMKYAWPSTVNVANFVTVKPSVEGDEKRNFNNWKEQMVCLLESQEVQGFVNGEIVPPGEDETELHKLWRRTDRLVKGWILGSVGTDVLDAVRDKETARDVWLHLDNIFKQEEEKEKKDSESEEVKNESTGEDFSRYLPLKKAAMRGDWDTAKNFFQDINELSTTIISSQSETALHVAVSTGKANDLVNKLVDLMPREALGRQDCYWETALHKAAVVGNTEAATALVMKNLGLLSILNNRKRLAVQTAAVFCQKKTLNYLISEHEANEEHRRLFEHQLGVRLWRAILSSEYVDIAWDLAHKYPNLAVRRYMDESALSLISGMVTLFPRTDTFTWRQKFIYHLGQKLESMSWYAIENLVPKVKVASEKKARRQQALDLAEYLCDQIVSKVSEKEASTIFEQAIKRAAENGISEIVETIIHKFPDATFCTDSETGRNIFHVAASYRYENIINLIYNMSDRKHLLFDVTDAELNNLLHICGKLAPPHRLNLVAGAALQMQRELQWFQEMKKYVHPSRRIWPNIENKTPQMIFTKEHEKLKADGERWMKDTANACTIAAALIATVMFAAAFTVPGGVESTTGIPLFTGRAAFQVFAISDAISLFTSITSLLMFLSILTSRYAEEDFLYILPRRLSMGLLSLFVSIIFMLLAFSDTLYLLLQRDITWVVVFVVVFACLPVTSFVLLQFPLLVDVLYSTYGPGIFGKKSDRILY